MFYSTKAVSVIVSEYSMLILTPKQVVVVLISVINDIISRRTESISRLMCFSS